MRDAFARKIDYMRVSITDRCNLRCGYCMPEDVPFMAHDDIMRFEELLRICSIMAGLGVKTIRVTGGEPLVRRGCFEFIKALKEMPGIENVALTTNGVYLEQHLEGFAAMGLDGLNISLDSLSPEIYSQITGFDAFNKTWDAIVKAVDLGLRVKINCVLMKGINDSQILPMVALLEQMPIDVRFIELMPTGFGKNLDSMAKEEILGIIQEHYPNLEEDYSKHGFGPAKYFKASGMKGSIGFISAVSDIFCATCNRIRLSSEGFLLLCLHYSDGIDLRAMLRGGASDEEIAAAIKESIKHKPEKHSLDKQTELKHMSKIGG